ncbi:MAG TPA: TlyA family RNA methyltransferase [Candidatus Acidoferrales bacterium]|nr:TlyA family RNA methyltransferase [Candidatus Acidoferrales bacterium]
MKPRAPKIRLDVLLVGRGLASSRQRAQALLLAGNVIVNGQPASKPGALIAEDAEIRVSGEAIPYSSRGGLKLEGALEDFHLSPAGKICLDAGSSAGGFTDCLLQRGAARVYAVDVNVKQLDWKLTRDARVVPIECNVRYLKPEQIPESIDIVVIDLSFISVAKVLPAIAAVARPGADFLILIKPQFELERADIGKGGIVRDPALHQRAIERVTNTALEHDLEPAGVHPSRVPGAEGNLEFFLHAVHKPSSTIAAGRK